MCNGNIHIIELSKTLREEETCVGPFVMENYQLTGKEKRKQLVIH